ncbi:hypothetical protein WEI85_14695 [Actinomycetes bacterium KLBMP 9797]
MANAGLVLETSAVLGYAEGLPEVGTHIARLAKRAEDVVIPALCLAEAYRRIDSDGWHLLDVLAEHPNVIVTPVERDMCSILGGWTRAIEQMDVAQAAIEAASRPMVPIMTDKAEEVKRFLVEEWPVIEL